MADLDLLREWISLALSERIRSRTFDWERFKEIASGQSLRAMRRYADEHLERLGAGSSRAVYAFSPGRVLKIALERGRGPAQNKAEVDVYTNPATRPIVTAIYDEGANYRWIISDIVRPLAMDYWSEEEGYDDFKSLSGISWRDLWRGIRVTDQRPAYDEEEARLAAHPLVKAVASLMKANDLLKADLERMDHWGKTADGRLVILDYGYTRDVRDKHY